MKNTFIITLLSIFLSNIMNGEDYSYIVPGGKIILERNDEKTKDNIEYTKLIQAILPVGSTIAEPRRINSSCFEEKIFISSISEDEINIAYTTKLDVSPRSSMATSSHTSLHLGSCKVGKQIWIRMLTNFPAIKINVVSIDMEKGTAILIITKEWPEPNDTKVQRIDPKSK